MICFASPGIFFGRAGGYYTDAKNKVYEQIFQLAEVCLSETVKACIHISGRISNLQKNGIFLNQSNADDTKIEQLHHCS